MNKNVAKFIREHNLGDTNRRKDNVVSRTTANETV